MYNLRETFEDLKAQAVTLKEAYEKAHKDYKEAKKLDREIDIKVLTENNFREEKTQEQAFYSYMLSEEDEDNFFALKEQEFKNIGIQVARNTNYVHMFRENYLQVRRTYIALLDKLSHLSMVISNDTTGLLEEVFNLYDEILNNVNWDY